jgi:hypothetical protein
MTNVSSTLKGKEDEPKLDTVRGGFAALKDSQGRFRTQSLFWESRHPDMKPVFTMKKREHEGCISMYEKYMEIADPTEYQVAIRLLGSWDHWQKLCRLPWFKEMADEWRAELKIRMASDRYYEMAETARDHKGQPNGIQATKWLSEQYGEKPQSKRGRPSKAEKEAALKQAASDMQDLEDDALIIGLVK